VPPRVFWNAGKQGDASSVGNMNYRLRNIAGAEGLAAYVVEAEHDTR
jgi:hypothetical protein